MKLNAAEKELIKAYRAADEKTKETVMELLSPKQEEQGNALMNILTAVVSAQQGQQNAEAQENNGGGLLGAFLSNVANNGGEASADSSPLTSLLSGFSNGTAQNEHASDNTGAGGLASFLMGLLK